MKKFIQFVITIIFISFLAIAWMGQMVITQQLTNSNQAVIEEFSKLRVQLQESERQNQETKKQLQYFMDQLGIEPAELSSNAPYDNKSGMCNDGDPITAAGTLPKEGTLGGNLNLTPIGTKVIILGHGICTVEDRCPYYETKGIIGFDIFSRTSREAEIIGRSTKNVLIVKS